MVDAGNEFNPVVVFDCCSSAGAVFLFSKAALESFHVDRPAFFGGHELGEVDREAVGVEEFEGKVSVDGICAGVSVDVVFKAFDASGKGFEEGLFFFEDDALDELLLFYEFGILGSHLGDEGINEGVDEGFFETEEGVAVADGTTQDATYDVTSLGVAGELTVGDAEADSAKVVGNDAHGNVGLVVLAIGAAGKAGYMLDEGLEDVGVVVGFFALHDHAETFEAHAGVDVLGFEGLEGTVGKAVVLHEDKIPDFDYEGVVFVDKVAAGDLEFVGGVAEVYMDFATGTAGTLFSHFPEVVFLGTFEDAAFVDVLFPVVVGFSVHFEAVFLIASEDGDVEVVFVDMENFGEEFPAKGDGFAFEVVAEGPVAKHFEHGVVVGVVADFFEVVVLATDAKTFLCVADAGERSGGVAEEDVFELVHASVGEHEGGVVFDYHGIRRHNMMPFAFEKLEELIADFVAGHCIIIIDADLN